MGEKKPFRTALLMIHGYSGSPQEFAALTAGLSKAGIPYYSPRLTGFGLNDFHLLHRIKASDWLRDVDEAYAVLDALAEEVNVLGQSTGGTLATLLATRRPVKNLILVGPNLIPSPVDRKYKKLLNTPLLGNLVAFALPVFTKPVRPGRKYPSDTRDNEAARRAFSYFSLPTTSLRVQWQLQDMADISKAKFESLTLLYGEKDATVNNLALLEYLKQETIPFQSWSFPASGHNIFQDYDRQKAVKQVIDILTPL